MSASSPPLPESFSSAAASSSPGPSRVPPVAGSRSASGIQAAAGAALRFAQLRAALRSPPPQGVGGGRPAPLFRRPLASPAPPPWPPASLRFAPLRPAAAPRLPAPTAREAGGAAGGAEPGHRPWRRGRGSRLQRRSCPPPEPGRTGWCPRGGGKGLLNPVGG